MRDILMNAFAKYDGKYCDVVFDHGQRASGIVDAHTYNHMIEKALWYLLHKLDCPRSWTVALTKSAEEGNWEQLRCTKGCNS